MHRLLALDCTSARHPVILTRCASVEQSNQMGKIPGLAGVVHPIDRGVTEKKVWCPLLYFAETGLVVLVRDEATLVIDVE